jgi:hypothetical protein
MTENTENMEWRGTADARRLGSIRRSAATRRVLRLLSGKLRSLKRAALDGRSASLSDKGRGTAALAK